MTKKSGFTMIEMMVALVLSFFCVMVLASLTTIKIGTQEDVDYQISLIAVDGFMSEVYKEFKTADIIDVSSENDGSYVSISFSHVNGDSVIYTYNQASGEMRRNNIPIFNCYSVNAEYTANNLQLHVKLEDDKVLDLNVFR